MCDECFRIAEDDGFPKEISDRYRRRNLRFRIEGIPAGDISHFRFFHHSVGGGEEFWKGVEFCTFDGGRREYRICYWANRGAGKGWRWGQFAVFFPEKLWKAVSEYVKDHPDGKP
jgi:hypothetical protein